MCACVRESTRINIKLVFSSPLIFNFQFSIFYLLFLFLFFWGGEYLRLVTVGLWVDKGTVSFADGEVDLTGVDKRHSQEAYEAWVVPTKYLPTWTYYTSYRLCTTTNCTYLV